MSTVKTEQVLVVPTAAFHELGHFQGATHDVERYLPQLLAADLVSYRPRAEMEVDPSYKQLIPYVIFQYQDEAGRKSLFQYTRGSGQGESRLHEKCSIGVGGHISKEDASASDDDPYQEGMRRELEEEVIIDTPYTQRCVGLINDDENEVGRVHLGVVHIVEVERPSVTSRETEILSAGFQTLDQLRQRRDAMETWSSICLEHFFADI